ncbi:MULTISPECIES: hypothetical protein [Cloacibacterium]
MATLFIMSCIGFAVAGFITGVLFSIYFNKDFKEDLSKPNNDYD